MPVDDGCSISSDARLWLCNLLAKRFFDTAFFTFVSQNAGILVLMLALLIFSAYFSSAETAVTAISRVRIKAMADNDEKRAKTAMRLLNNFEKTLTTILVGNNLVNIAMGSFSAVLALRVGIPAAVMTLIVTVAVILFGETLPKTVSKQLGELYTLRIAASLRFFSVVLTPFSAFFTAISRLISRIFAKKGVPTVTEDDVIDMIEDMEEDGAIDSDESRLLYSAFEFGDVTVKDVLTDRRDMLCIDAGASPEELLDIIKTSPYSRLPVYKGDLDSIIGVLRIREYLERFVDGEQPDLWDLLDQPCFVSPETKIETLLATMKKLKKPLAIVQTRKGRTIGLVTMEDMLEELVGEIWDENDKIEEKFQQLDERTFLISADLSVVSAFEMMDYEDYDRDECGHYTLRKWVGKMLSGVPKNGSAFSYRRLHITAEKVFRGRLLSLKFEIDEPEDASEEQEA